ncbi:MAG: DNA methyltransferase, partial [Thermoplasmata archaeon]
MECYWFFKLFNNIKSEHESVELAKLELESLFGVVEPIFNFANKLCDEPLCRFMNLPERVEDYITYELPYGRIQGYSGISKSPDCFGKLVRRLGYTREIYLIMELNGQPEDIAKSVFPEGSIGKNFHFFRADRYICFRAITHQYFLEKSEYISKLSRNEHEVEKNVKILFSYPINEIYRIPASSTLSIGKRLQDYFAIREEPSLYLSHYFHPYKGKFHPKMARALLNYICPHDEGVVLDNFAGSGTLLVESSLMGLTSIGIEINPLSVLMCNVKTNSLLIDINKLKVEITRYFKNVREIIKAYENVMTGQPTLDSDKNRVINKIREKSKFVADKLKNCLSEKEKVIPQILLCREQICLIEDKLISDFLLLGLSGAISDITRRTKDEFLDVFERRVEELYLRLFLFRKLSEILKIDIGESTCYVGDTRNMKEFIEDEIIDGIVNSPPYSVALDYIKNDYPQLVLLELTDSIEKIEEEMIGNPRVNYDRKELLEKIKTHKNNPL